MIKVVKTADDFKKALKEKTICYISGPITGVEDYWNRFLVAEHMLAEKDLFAINPAGAFPEGLPYEWYMDVDMKLVDKCESLCFLDGYEKSNGAAREAKRADWSRKDYWAFTLKQFKAYCDYLSAIIELIPDASAAMKQKVEQEIKEKQDCAKKTVAKEGAALEAWILEANPPKTETQKKNDKVKKVLRSYQYCQNQIDAACDEITKLDTRRKRITVQYREVHGGGGSDYAEAVIDNITSLEENIVAMTKQLQSERTKVQFWIDALEDLRERNVLTMCYINDMRFEEIGAKLNYSLDHVKRLHRRGIDKLRDLFADEIAKM